MRKWIIIVLGYVVLIGALVLVIRNSGKYEDRWKTAEANVKAYDRLLGSSEERNAAYQLTVDQLNSVNDSILKELNDTRKKLRIKDRNVKSVQYVASGFSKTDTVVVDSIVFRSMAVDTLLGNEWYSLRLRMHYPDTVIVSPSFKSEKSIIVSTRRETVNPPKKLWILRLFQKKHTVVHVDVVEKSPYITDSESRYVEILK